VKGGSGRVRKLLRGALDALKLRKVVDLKFNMTFSGQPVPMMSVTMSNRR